MAEFLEDNQDQGTPPLPSGYVAVKKTDSATPPLPSGYEPLKKKESSDSNYVSQISSVDSEPPIGSSATPKIDVSKFGNLSQGDFANVAPKQQKEGKLNTDQDLVLRKLKLRKEIDEGKKKGEHREVVLAKIDELNQIKAKQDQIAQEKVNAVVQRYQPEINQATTLTPEEQANAQADYDLAKSGTSFWQKTKEFGANALNVVANKMNQLGLIDEVGDLKPEKPLKKYEDQVLEEAHKNNETLTPQQKDERVKDLYLKEKNFGVIQSKLNDLNDKLTPEEQTALLTDRYGKVTHLSNENKNLLKSAQVIKGSRDDSFKTLVDTRSQIIQLQKANQPIPQELVSQYQDSLDKTKKYDDQLGEFYSKYNKNKDDIGTFEQEYNVYKTENNDFLNFGNRIVNAVGRMGAESLDFGAYLANAGVGVKPGTGNEIADILHGHAKNINKFIEADNQYLKNTASIEDAGDFVSKSVDFVADNLPMVVGLALGGETALGQMTTGAMGGKYGEMAEEEEAGKANYSQAQKIFAPMAYGATMIAPMATQLRTIRNGARVLEAIERESPELIKKSLMDKSADILKKYAKDTFRLGNELKGMEILQEGVNHFMLGKDVDYKKLSDLGVYQTAPLLHAMNMAVPHILMVTTKPFMSDKEVKQLDQNSAKIFDLYGKLHDQKLSPEEKTIIQETINDLSKNSKNLVKSKIDEIASRPQEVTDEIINATQKSSDIRAKALRIKSADESTFSKGQKEVILKDLENKYRENEKHRIDLLSGEKGAVELLPLKEQDKFKRQALRELTEEQNPDGKKNITIDNGQILERANKLYKKQKAENEVKPEVAITEQESKAQPQAEVQKTEQENVELNTSDKFKKTVDLFNQINETEGGSKKRELVKERKAFLDEHPTVKYIDDNIREVTKQLEEKGELTKSGDCP